MIKNFKWNFDILQIKNQVISQNFKIFLKHHRLEIGAQLILGELLSSMHTLVSLICLSLFYDYVWFGGKFERKENRKKKWKKKKVKRNRK